MSPSSTVTFPMPAKPTLKAANRTLRGATSVAQMWPAHGADRIAAKPVAVPSSSMVSHRVSGSRSTNARVLAKNAGYTASGALPNWEPSGAQTRSLAVRAPGTGTSATVPNTAPGLAGSGASRFSASSVPTPSAVKSFSAASRSR